MAKFINKEKFNTNYKEVTKRSFGIRIMKRFLSHVIPEMNRLIKEGNTESIHAASIISVCADVELNPVKEGYSLWQLLGMKLNVNEDDDEKLFLKKAYKQGITMKSVTARCKRYLRYIESFDAKA